MMKNTNLEEHKQIIKSFKGQKGLSPPPLDSNEQIPSRKDKAKFRKHLLKQYIQLLKTYERGSRLKESPLILELVSDFAELSFSAKEILDLHAEAIDRVAYPLSTLETQHLVIQSRYLILGVMVHLVEFYRQRR
jgi:hypothetical protein